MKGVEYFKAGEVRNLSGTFYKLLLYYIKIYILLLQTDGGCYIIMCQ